MTFRSIIFCLIFLLLPNLVYAREIRLAVTTSFHNSGLSDLLLPHVKSDLDLDVHLIVVGTGQALRLGRAGDVDAILVHSREAEEEFITEGYGTSRRDIMYNDFIFIGPASDPAKIANVKSVSEALRRLAKSKSLFVSRGDDSGTHRKEMSLWKNSGIDVSNHSTSWYRSVGSGMGATLNAASGMNAYVMSDRASWLKFKNKGGLKLLYSGDPTLFNQYAFLPVNPARHEHVKSKLSAQLEAWLTSPKGQGLIGQYKINSQALFTPNATPDS